MSSSATFGGCSRPRARCSFTRSAARACRESPTRGSTNTSFRVATFRRSRKSCRRSKAPGSSSPTSKFCVCITRRPCGCGASASMPIGQKPRSSSTARFCRMWDFYLASAEAAFRSGYLVVFQIQLVRDQTALPLTRDYMFEEERRLRAPAKLGARRPSRRVALGGPTPAQLQELDQGPILGVPCRSQMAKRRLARGASPLGVFADDPPTPLQEPAAASRPRRSSGIRANGRPGIRSADAAVRAREGAESQGRSRLRQAGRQLEQVQDDLPYAPSSFPTRRARGAPTPAAAIARGVTSCATRKCSC